MRKIQLIVFLLVLPPIVSSVYGCRSKVDLDALVAERIEAWKKLAENPDKYLETHKPMELMAEIIALRRDGFLPIYDIFANPDTPPKVRLLAHESLKVVVVSDEEGFVASALIAPLAETSPDPMIRACAIELVALTQDKRYVELFQKLKQDADPRVRLAALCGLTRFEDDSARAELIRLYTQQDLSLNERNRILIELLRKPRGEDLPIFTTAFQDSEIPQAIKTMIAVTFGSLGGNSELVLLQHAASDPSTPPELKSAIEGAVASLENKVKQSKQ